MAKFELPDGDAAPTPNGDDPFEKHINIALEAQDGPTETPNTEEPSKGEEAPKPAPKEDSTGSTGDNTAQPKPNKEGTEEKQPSVRAKDLTLPDGTVVKGGAERRFYEQREVARQQATQYQQQLTQERNERSRIQTELETLRNTVQSVNGADPQQVAIGVTIVRDLQRDPVGTMKKLLAEVVAQGHTIEGIGAGVDQLAVQRMIDARLPQQENTGPSEEDIVRTAQEEANNFYTRFPDARPHDALLARMLSDNPGVDLNTAYFDLKNAFIERGFDWTRSLEDNLKDGVSTQQQPQADNKAPLPNGRPTTPNVKPADEVKIAHEDTDMSDIVRQAMRESGLNV